MVFISLHSLNVIYLSCLRHSGFLFKCIFWYLFYRPDVIFFSLKNWGFPFFTDHRATIRDYFYIIFVPVPQQLYLTSGTKIVLPFSTEFPCISCDNPRLRTAVLYHNYFKKNIYFIFISWSKAFISINLFPNEKKWPVI